MHFVTSTYILCTYNKCIKHSLGCHAYILNEKFIETMRVESKVGPLLSRPSILHNLDHLCEVSLSLYIATRSLVHATTFRTTKIRHDTQS